MVAPNKSLGQHWLKDRDILADVAAAAQLTSDDAVLEIGPGLGTLTSELLRRAQSVVAVEFDELLAQKLPGQFPGKKLEVIHEDILQFDLSRLPKGYKVVANVPYYITSKIVEKLVTAANKPSLVVLLVQKEVAERIAAQPGEMSLLAIAAQIYAEATLGVEVPAEFFTPPPKVDSQVVVLKMRSEPLVDESELALLFRVARAGFAARRKKLRSSLSGGLALDKRAVETWLTKVNIDPNLRAQDLSLTQWQQLIQQFPGR